MLEDHLWFIKILSPNGIQQLRIQNVKINLRIHYAINAVEISNICPTHASPYHNVTTTMFNGRLHMTIMKRLGRILPTPVTAIWTKWHGSNLLLHILLKPLPIINAHVYVFYFLVNNGFFFTLDRSPCRRKHRRTISLHKQRPWARNLRPTAFLDFSSSNILITNLSSRILKRRSLPDRGRLCTRPYSLYCARMPPTVVRGTWSWPAMKRWENFCSL